MYLDQEAVTKTDWQIGAAFNFRLSIVTENDLQTAKLTFLGKIPLVAFEFNFITAT